MPRYWAIPTDRAGAPSLERTGGGPPPTGMGIPTGPEPGGPRGDPSQRRPTREVPAGCPARQPPPSAEPARLDAGRRHRRVSPLAAVRSLVDRPYHRGYRYEISTQGDA